MIASPLQCRLKGLTGICSWFPGSSGTPTSHDSYIESSRQCLFERMEGAKGLTRMNQTRISGNPAFSPGIYTSRLFLVSHLNSTVSSTSTRKIISTSSSAIHCTVSHNSVQHSIHFYRVQQRDTTLSKNPSHEPDQQAHTHRHRRGPFQNKSHSPPFPVSLTNPKFKLESTSIQLIASRSLNQSHVYSSHSPNLACNTDTTDSPLHHRTLPPNITLPFHHLPSNPTTHSPSHNASLSHFDI